MINVTTLPHLKTARFLSLDDRKLVELVWWDRTGCVLYGNINTDNLF